MSRKKHGGGEHAEEHPDERWLVSYSDMITVLMILFIMLYAISSVNVSKYHALKDSASEALGADPSGKQDPTGPDKPNTNPQKKKESKETGSKEAVPASATADQTTATLKAAIKKAGLSGRVEVTNESRGVVMRFSDAMLFDSGSAVITAGGGKVMNALSPVLRATEKPLTVEGHTDNRPIRTGQFPSNWELSAARSIAVLRQLNARGVPAKRLGAAGYADVHPRATNATDAGRLRNRRVEIVVHVGTPPQKSTSVAKG